ncbi:MAG TPA: methylmalonyl-CoA mutase family protein [Hanamia sp.]|nr:methylmalonyl-CoA mutase family protein [Hanamia sp.]
MKKVITGLRIEIKKVSVTKNQTQDIYKKIPGEIPFTKEVKTNKSRGKIWTIRQYSDSGKFSTVHLFIFNFT